MNLRAPGLHAGLMTDLYHPDSAYVSWRTDRNGLTTFDLYTRTLPFGGAYLLVAGIEAALEFVQAFRFCVSSLASRSWSCSPSESLVVSLAL